MRAASLGLAALLLPLAWGYAVHWAVERLWPVNPSRSANATPRSGSDDSAGMPDYQI
ncbi:MAG: hypothetical protein WD069_17730 [Planctomycetales bacterium]